jgi:hypothetical protein
MSRAEFYGVVTAAIHDLMEHGFDSQERLDRWLVRIQEAARRALIPESVLVRSLQDALGQVYQRTTQLGKLARAHPGVSHFTLEMIKPKLRAELDRRILASASLIKLNREASIARTLQRFAGWASSVPKGGTEIANRKEVKDTVRRGIASLPFEERRVIVDQGHKLVAAINDIVATDGGAIAAEWRHVREGGGYQARPEHEKRHGKVFVIRDNWAMKQGLMKLAGAEYTDEIEAPGELVSCRCSFSYFYTLRDLPAAMLTSKGRAALAEVRAKIRGFSHAAH